jgi:Methyltransferase domain
VDRGAEAAWDREYELGRYRDEPPLAFVEDIVIAARSLGPGPASGLYVGCGNGRNFVPLLKRGIELTGLDISATAIAQLRERLPERSHTLIHGDLTSTALSDSYPIVIGIQVFQHGSRAESHSQLALAKSLVAAGGSFCLRVNATSTDIWPTHEVVERSTVDGFTVRYLVGPKEGMLIHFFSRREIEGLFVGWHVEVPLRLSVSSRTPPAPGQWSQWEGIWRKPDAN